jgi:hypothetical protein
MMIRCSSAAGRTAVVRFLAMAGDFSLLHSIKTGFGAHPASYPVGTGALSPEIKRPRHEADHSSPSSAEVKNDGAISPPPPPHTHTASWRNV